MHRHNWRKAASFIYQYSTRLKAEADQRDYLHSSLDLQERLNGLSAAINALHLVHPAYAWIDPLLERPVHEERYPSKKAKRTVEEERKYCGNNFLKKFHYFCIFNYWGYHMIILHPSQTMSFMFFAFCILYSFCLTE